MTSIRATRKNLNMREMLDNVIHQLDFTKKLMIIMLLSFLVVIPILAVIAYLSQSMASVGVFIPIIGGAVFLVWLGVGIRQWSVFKMEAQVSRIQGTAEKG